MAHFRKRSGAWEVTVQKKGIARISRTFDTKAEAEEWAKLTEADMAKGLAVRKKESEGTTFSEALERYRTEISSTKRGASQESSRINILQKSVLANRALSTIHGKDIASYRDERLKEGVSAGTVLKELSIISHLFTIAAKEWGMTDLANPCLLIRKPKAPQGRDRRLAPGELDRILSESGSAVLEDIVFFALETAMRQEEIAKMRWEHVDLKKRVLMIPEAKVDSRRIPLSSMATQILKKLPNRLDGSVWGITPHAISVAWRRAVFRARTAYEKEFEEKSKGKKNAKPNPLFLVDLTFHDLRHEATSRLFENGLNPMQVAAITGHKTLQMLKRYTHLKAEDLVKLLK